MKSVAILVSNEKRLKLKYKKEADAILKKLEKYKTFLTDEAIETRILLTKKIEPSDIREEFSSFEKKYLNRKEVYFLIIGGDDIVPFFKLDNPTDDEDDFIYSDSPYASRDEEYSIPERIVGRLPDINDSEGSDSKFFLSVLDNFIFKHKLKRDGSKSFGYTASVWKKTSKAVYRVIKNGEKLIITPPVTKDNFEKEWIAKKRYLYFNLHGSKETNCWYGQRGFGDPEEYPYFPVAFIPELVKDVGSSVVFSEACYGGYIFGKTDSTAISLKFLAENSDLFIGASAIAYGPIEPPSTEADLLCKYFFQYVNKGLTYGSAFLNAKIDFAKKMIRTQGFLDEDDKKTLIEFNFFGDPTLRIV